MHRLQHLRLILHQLSSAKDAVFHLGRLKLRNRIITTTHSQRVVLVVMHLRTPIQYGRTQREVLHHALKGKFCTTTAITSSILRRAKRGGSTLPTRYHHNSFCPIEATKSCIHREIRRECYTPQRPRSSSKFACFLRSPTSSRGRSRPRVGCSGSAHDPRSRAGGA